MRSSQMAGRSRQTFFLILAHSMFSFSFGNRPFNSQDILSLPFFLLVLKYHVSTDSGHIFTSYFILFNHCLQRLYVFIKVFDNPLTSISRLFKSSISLCRPSLCLQFLIRVIRVNSPKKKQELINSHRGKEGWL